jgi:uncharacterized protein YjbI with pentapeptide repeats
MPINRRHLVFAGAAAVTTSSAAPDNPLRRVSQGELYEAIRLHGMWLADSNTGRRCTFEGRDLSGLYFGSLGGAPTDLSGADFAQADLSGAEADDILVHHCNFNGAKFDGSHWRRPVFAFADMRRASARRVAWGKTGGRGSKKRSPADFTHTVLNDTDLSEAQICGLFYGTKMARASLVGADLSLSDFLGPMHHEMSFVGAKLNEARLRHCHISSVNFSHADCSYADFSRSIFSNLIIKDCNLSGAVFHEAEFERTVSPHQTDDLYLRQTMISASGVF